MKLAVHEDEYKNMLLRTISVCTNAPVWRDQWPGFVSFVLYANQRFAYVRRKFFDRPDGSVSSSKFNILKIVGDICRGCASQSKYKI